MLHVKQVEGDPLALTVRLAERYSLDLPPGSIDRLERYVKSLLEWNKKLNLISRSDTENIWPRHILHSLLPVLLFKIPSNIRFVDIGTGGGLPGLPIAIVRPDLTGVLVDSIRKKTDALTAIVSDLGISNVRVISERVEGPEFLKKFQSSFDIVFARAVSQLPDVVKWSIKLLRKRKPRIEEENLEAKVLIDPPAIVSFKGGDIREEVERTVRLFPGTSVDEYPIDVEGITDELFTGKKLLIVKPQA